MRRFVKGALAAVGIVSAAALTTGAGFLTNGLPPAGTVANTLPMTGNELFPGDTQLSGGVPPQSAAYSSAQLASGMAQAAWTRNYLDNGAMQVNQQGTATITGGTTSITGLQFAADRWFVDTNVGSGAGQAAIITASPSPPTGFQQSVKMWRNSGALLQPVCMIQAIETARSIQLQGKSVVFSGYLQPLAAFTAAGGTVNATLITGTGSDEGIATLTASPAITPAWTGIASQSFTSGNGVVINSTALAAGTAGFPIGTTAAWNRVWSAPLVVPAAATEVGIEVCFTPVGTASGATDGFAMTGLQLEVVGATSTQTVQLGGTSTTAVPGPSIFEYKPFGLELLQAQRFFYPLKEPANGAAVQAFGEATGAGANALTVWLPVQMRGTTPTITITTAGTFKVNIAGTPTTVATPTAGVCSVTSCTVTAANTNTAGQAQQVTGGGGTGVWNISSDKVM